MNVKNERKAIVTLAVGKKYEKMFDKNCSRSWRQYCEKFHYDLIVIREPIDKSDRANKRSPAWRNY